MLGNISSQTAWAIIRLSKPRTKPRTLRHEARDEIFPAPSPFFGGGAWVRGYDDTVCVCEDEGGRVVSNQTLGCVMIQCVYVKMKGEGL